MTHTVYLAWKRVFILKCTDCDTKPLLDPLEGQIYIDAAGIWWGIFSIHSAQWSLNGLASTVPFRLYFIRIVLASTLHFWLRVFNTKLTSSYSVCVYEFPSHYPWYCCYCCRRRCRCGVRMLCDFFFSLSFSLSLSFAGVHISEPFIQHSITSNYNANDSMAGDGSRVVVRTLIVFRSIMFCIGKQQSTPQTLHHSNLLGFDYLFGIIGIICIYIYCGNSRRKYKFNKNAHKHKSRNP